MGIGLELLDHLGDLVDSLPAGGLPGAPLGAVDRAQLALLVGPLVPDAHAALLQVAYVGIAVQDPEQLVNDGLNVQLLGGEQGVAGLQVVARLVAEDGQGACAGAVLFAKAVIEDMSEQVQVLLHGGLLGRYRIQTINTSLLLRAERGELRSHAISS